MTIEEDRTDQRVRTVCQLILAVIAVGVALSLLRAVLVPFCLALLLTYSLTPVIDFQMKNLRFPRALALVGVGIVGILISLLLMYLTAVSVGEMVDHFDEYREQLGQLKDWFARAVPWNLIGLGPRERTEQAFTLSETTTRQILGASLNTLTDLVTTGTLVVIFMLFLLLGRSGPSPDPTSLLGEIERRVRRYLLRLVGLSALTGLLVGLSLAILGVRFALVFGFLAFLLNFIPNVGSIVATLLPMPVALLSPELSATQQVLALVVPGAIQFLIGYVIQPRFYGFALDLHPVTVLLALIFFGMIWGFIGTFLAMPITGVIRIVFERIPATRGLGALMAGDLRIISLPVATSRQPPAEP